MHTTTPISSGLSQFHVTDLISTTDSKISSVNLYPTRAEVTRLFNVTVKCGPNRINIKGLPTVVDQDSIRVEGKGSATIHDVIFSTTPPSNPNSPKSPKLNDLLHKRKRLEKALERCTESLLSLKAYLGTLNVQHLQVSQLSQIMEGYDTAAEQLDDKSLDLEEQLLALKTEIKAEQLKPTPTRTNVGIDLVATVDGDIEIVLIYAVHAQCASWDAKYDIRASVESTTVSLVYKASISQTTGESWDNVPLTLETANPTFGADIPSLTPWMIRLQHYQTFRRSTMLTRTASEAPSTPGMVRSRIPRKDESAGIEAPPDTAEEIINSFASITSSKGDISATFQVPGLITIPSDGTAHNVTIAELSLDAVMSWIAVPKKDTRVHLKAKIANVSDYSLLKGTASMFIDGSFTSRSYMPTISPQEIFELDLGVDPSVRTTYHPQAKNYTHSGAYWKQVNSRNCTQRITVFNSKAIPINIKVVDQIPISEDPNLTVKLIAPALNKPSKGSSISVISTGEGVKAQWEGTDEQDPESLGKDGNVSWQCSIPPQGKAQLALQWEVTSSELRHTIIGL